MHRGYVKLWRKSNNSVVFEDPELWKLWCICLMMATHKPMTTLLPETKVGIKLEPGQFLTGRFALHELYYPKKKKKNETRKSPVTLWRWLQKLESMEKLIIKSYSKASVITILNWNDYQVDDQQMINRCSTGDQQVITDKNVKNVKNDKKTTTTDRPVFISPELWTELLKNRTYKKLQNTPLALKTFCNSLEKAMEAGYTVEECIGEYVACSWKRFDHTWMKKDKGNGSKTARQENIDNISNIRKGIENGTGFNPYREVKKENSSWNVDKDRGALPE